jgi:predicted DNA-binding transcriptional regulator AlpA
MSREPVTLPDPAAVALDDIPIVLGELECLKARLWARISAPAATSRTPDPDQLLGAKIVAQRAGISARWLYRHADTLPFTRRIGRKVLFSSAGLTKWLASRRPDTHTREGGTRYAR